MSTISQTTSLPCSILAHADPRSQSGICRNPTGAGVGLVGGGAAGAIYSKTQD